MRHLTILASLAAAAALLGACGGSTPTNPAVPTGDTAPTTTEPEDTEPPQGACGDTLYHTVEVLGLVENSDGSPAVGASVQLEERTFEPQVQVWGEGTVTDANGAFSFTAVDIVEVEDCWGTIVDYAIVAQLGDSSAEDRINSTVRNAVAFGDPVDLSFFPLVLDP